MRIGWRGEATYRWKIPRKTQDLRGHGGNWRPKLANVLKKSGGGGGSRAGKARPKADADVPGYTADAQRAYAVGLRRFRRPASGTASCPFQSRHITGDQRFFLCSCPTLQLPFTFERVLSRLL
jgi:hypothetical protein